MFSTENVIMQLLSSSRKLCGALNRSPSGSKLVRAQGSVF